MPDKLSYPHLFDKNKNQFNKNGGKLSYLIERFSNVYETIINF